MVETVKWHDSPYIILTLQRCFTRRDG